MTADNPIKIQDSKLIFLILKTTSPLKKRNNYKNKKKPKNQL